MAQHKFRWLESRLAGLGFRLVLCWRHAHSFTQARRKRLQVSSNPSQYDDLTIFIREQEIIQELVKNSLLSSLLVDVTETKIDDQIEYIADWLDATGELNAALSRPNPKRSLRAVQGLQLAVSGNQ